MIELISKNYEWVFSGVGVLFLTLIINYVRKNKNLDSKKINEKYTIEGVGNENNVLEKNTIKDNSVNIQNSDNANVQIANNLTNNFVTIEKEKEKGNSRISNFDATEIRDKIENSPPFQKKQIAKNYSGIRIKWDVSYQMSHDPEENNVRIMSLFEGHYPWVCFNVNLEEYPIFKTAEKDVIFTIIGKIIEYDGGTFEIEIEDIIEK